ncbi:hypothetical protein Patl1_15373 [Pistacia atlantica]|uniref:Uncharacterized protein n=1 Tax=Pistacia atlantica TaxID=434234 RepID=A0ACC1B8L9_9ROSI|nr:hypothetical protein Patl1_15373 [Pistacia atlantica]
MYYSRKRFPSDAINEKYTVDMTIRDSKYGLIRNGVERDTGRCLGTEVDDNFLYLVFENLPWDLDDFGRRQATIENQVSIKILTRFLSTMRYSSRDSSCKRVKVVYFGEPKSMDDLVSDWCLDSPAIALKAACLYYQAPEILFNGSSKVVDMWAVSLDLTKTFPGLEPARIDLISRMLCLDPEQRITPQEALEHEYFKDL